jgi:outer membrane scaffolding protein for murein synthesis (MipA/OmpV family)
MTPTPIDTRSPNRPVRVRTALAAGGRCGGLIALLLAGRAVASSADPAATGPGLATSERFEGAIGLVASYDAEFSGAGRHAWGFRPAGFLRWGRITLSGAGGFTTRSDQDVERGLATDLVRRRDWQVSLGLRYDNGRRESESEALDGLGDIARTVRARLQLQFRPDDNWRLSTSLSADVLNRGGGWRAELGASRRWRLTRDTQLRLSGDLTWGGSRYLQSWYGVDARQAAASGYPVYRPGAGLRDASIGVSLRSELGPHWAGFVGTGVSRLLGPTADSPLVSGRGDWSMTSGLVWRF